jgi:hypothetical protein
MNDDEIINFIYCDLINYKEEKEVNSSLCDIEISKNNDVCDNEINNNNNVNENEKNKNNVCNLNTNKNENTNDEQTFCQTLQSGNLNNNNMYQNYEEHYLINENAEEEKKKIFYIFKKKNSKKRKIKKIISLDGVFIPKVKHLNVEKKKNRVQYQENHRKIIYSYCHLTPPYDFEYIFRIIIDHQNKHSKNFKDKKSFHLIRNNKGNIIIVTFQEKQKIRKNNYY